MYLSSQHHRKVNSCKQALSRCPFSIRFPRTKKVYLVAFYRLIFQYCTWKCIIDNGSPEMNTFHLQQNGQVSSFFRYFDVLQLTTLQLDWGRHTQQHSVDQAAWIWICYSFWAIGSHLRFTTVKQTTYSSYLQLFTISELSFHCNTSTCFPDMYQHSNLFTRLFIF